MTAVTPDDVLDQKFRKLFSFVDADGSGSVERSDFVAVAARLNAAFNVSPSSDRGEAVAAAFERAWDGFAAAIGAGSGGGVDADTYAAGLSELFTSDPSAFDRLIAPMNDAVFELCDGDGDGVIDFPEFQAVQSALGASAEESAETFAALDLDQSRGITRDEVQAAVRSYFTSDDPAAPGNQFFGRLIG